MMYTTTTIVVVFVIVNVSDVLSSCSVLLLFVVKNCSSTKKEIHKSLKNVALIYIFMLDNIHNSASFEAAAGTLVAMRDNIF